MARDRRALREQQAASAARNRASLGKAPREAREHQRDRDLHDRDQFRVILSARVGRLDMTAEVEPVSETAARQLGDKREEA
jgi:hypothetical protein